jgi:hypothetical protein
MSTARKTSACKYWRKEENMRRIFTAALVAGTAALAAAVFAFGANAGPRWDPEGPIFYLDVVLRDVTGGGGFGHIDFRQPRDADQIAYLDTSVHLAPNHSYLLQRAVDTDQNGNCTSTAWLTLGRGLVPQAIATDGQGFGRELLWRDLSASPAGSQFDIHFQVIDAVTSAPLLRSDCHAFIVRR